MTCIRSAWLVLGGTSLLLDDMTNGYACESLDIGYGVRDVVDNVPDGDGAIDRTQYLGPRTVTIAIHAVENASPTQIDATASPDCPSAGGISR